MDTTSVEHIAERVEVELERLRTARPALSSRIERAEHIIVTQLSVSNGSRPIRVRIHADGDYSHVVRSGSKLRREYTVNPHTWSCDCPDARKRGGAACKHGIACWALGRAFRPAPSSRAQRTAHRRRCDVKPKTTRHDALEHVGEVAERVLADAAGGAS